MLESKLIYIKPALFQQEDGFKSVIPINSDLLNIHQKLNSEPLSSVFPFVSFDLTSDKGNTLRHQPTQFESGHF